MTFGAPAVTGRVPFLDASRRSRSCEAVVRSGSAHLAGLGVTWRNPPPQPGGRLPGRVCPVEPFSIVPRILAGGCLAPPPGGDVTEKRSLHVGPHGKARSVRWASRKGALCPRHSRRMRLSVRSCRQNALFRRVRFSSPGQTSSCLTQKRTLPRRPHAKAHSAPTISRKTAFWRF